MIVTSNILSYASEQHWFIQVTAYSIMYERHWNQNHISHRRVTGIGRIRVCLMRQSVSSPDKIGPSRQSMAGQAFDH